MFVFIARLIPLASHTALPDVSVTLSLIVSFLSLYILMQLGECDNHARPSNEYAWRSAGYRAGVGAGAGAGARAGGAPRWSATKRWRTAASVGSIASSSTSCPGLTLVHFSAQGENILWAILGGLFYNKAAQAALRGGRVVPPTTCCTSRAWPLRAGSGIYDITHESVNDIDRCLI